MNTMRLAVVAASLSSGAAFAQLDIIPTIHSPNSPRELRVSDDRDQLHVVAGGRATSYSIATHQVLHDFTLPTGIEDADGVAYTSISRDGRIAYGYVRQHPGPGSYRGFMYYSDLSDNHTYVDDPEIFRPEYPKTNGDGSAVTGVLQGYNIDDFFGVWRWSPSEGGSHTSGIYGGPVGISDDGRTIYAQSAGGYAYAWKDGVLTRLYSPAPSYQDWAEVRAMSENGDWAAGASLRESDGLGVPQLWYHNQPVIQITDDPYGVFQGISNDGAVGIIYNYANDLPNRYSVWSLSTGVMNFEEYLLAFGIAFPEGSSPRVYSVSGDGQTFMGTCTDVQTNSTAVFAVTVPAPAAGAILAGIELFTAGRRRVLSR